MPVHNAHYVPTQSRLYGTVRQNLRLERVSDDGLPILFDLLGNFLELVGF
jgi:hypothetical protein